ncbi:MAG: PAS domain-containing protein, partial [Bacteroidota bacterium]
MPASDKTTAQKKPEEIKDKLSFEYLPGYARFILENCHAEFSAEQLRLSREENIPLLKFISHFSEEELVQLGKISSGEFLNFLAENNAREYIEKSTSDYVKNRITFFDREQIVAEDITAVSFIRRKTLRSFLPLYTKDMSLFAHVMEEADRLVAESEAASFNAYLQIQQEKVSSINAFLELREQELLEAQELAGMGSFLWDLSGAKKSSFTPGLMKIFEMTKTSNLDSFLENVHEEDREKLKEALDKSFADDGMYECEYRFIKNNNEKKIWSRGKVTFKDGKPVNMKGTIMDVTNKYRLLDQLRESEELQKQAQRITHIGNWKWVIDSKKIEWSDEMYRIYGLEPQSEQITFERFISLVHPDDREKRKNEIQESLQTLNATDYVMRIMNPGGTVKVLRGKGQVITDSHKKPLML